MVREGRLRVHRIDGGHDRAHSEQPFERRFGQKSLKDGARLGEAGSFDDDVKVDLPGLAGMVEPIEGLDEIAEHRAAQASIFQHHDRVVTRRGEA